MAQHDYNVANATGANFRADVNNVLQAIVTVNSGAAEPSPTFAGMLWLDLSGGGDGVLKRRNAGNSAWLTDIGKDQIARDAAAAAQATADAAMPKSGGTFTGPINVPAALATNNQAISRAGADTLYQVKLPTAVGGALLLGAAGGWTSTLAPAANDNVLGISGGLPNWQATAQTANPNSIVRTKSDGTIDASFIPGVASGLKFCGTFKPVVNAEYPTTGGHGAAGAPAIGDFWVVDGLTTGGYTYLTGSLAGVTVYNGDSIAYNGASAWYRMGSTVEVQGYLKTDGSVAMAGALNMGAFAITNIGGLVGRAGPQVPMTNFVLDSTNIVVSPQRGTTGADLPPLAAGQLGTDIGRQQLFVGTGSTNAGLLPVRNFSTSAAYAANEYVFETTTSRLQRASAAVSAGAFTASQWRPVVDTGGATFVGGLALGAGSSLTLFAGIQQRFVKADGATLSSTLFCESGTGETRWTRGASTGEVALSIGAGTTYLSRVVTDVSFRSLSSAQFDNGISVSGGGIGNNLAPLSATAGAAALFERLGTTTSNTDWLDTSCVRVIAGGDWTGAAWRIRRLVDGTGQGYIEFGAQFQVVLGNGAKRVLVVDDVSNISVSNNLTVAGTVTAANIPGSDARLKANIAPIAARDLDALGFYAFDFIANGQHMRGCIAQDVEPLAPEFVHHYGQTDPERSGETRDRMTVDYAGLAFEVVMNLRDRVRALEGKPPIETPAFVMPDEPTPHNRSRKRK